MFLFLCLTFYKNICLVSKYVFYKNMFCFLFCFLCLQTKLLKTYMFVFYVFLLKKGQKRPLFGTLKNPYFRVEKHPKSGQNTLKAAQMGDLDHLLCFLGARD